LSHRLGIDSAVEGDKAPVSDRLQLIFPLPGYEKPVAQLLPVYWMQKWYSDGLLPWLLKLQVFSAHAPYRWQKLNQCDNKAIASELVKVF
jgi:hypothetical protein